METFLHVLQNGDLRVLESNKFDKHVCGEFIIYNQELYECQTRKSMFIPCLPGFGILYVYEKPMRTDIDQNATTLTPATFALALQPYINTTRFDLAVLPRQYFNDVFIYSPAIRAEVISNYAFLFQDDIKLQRKSILTGSAPALQYRARKPQLPTKQKKAVGIDDNISEISDAPSSSRGTQHYADDDDFADQIPVCDDDHVIEDDVIDDDDDDADVDAVTADDDADVDEDVSAFIADGREGEVVEEDEF